MKRLLLVAVLALLAAPAAHAQGNNWPALNQIADNIAGQHVNLTCESVSSEQTDPIASLFTDYNDLPSSRIWGYTFPGERSVTLSRLTCAGLLTLWAHPKMDETYTLYDVSGYNRGIEGMAIHALTHELGHIKYGYLATTALSERAAECYAQANDERAALAFGVTKTWAGWMHRTGEAFHSLLPSIYRDGSCP
jgi:hypothetical protein